MAAQLYQELLPKSNYFDKKQNMTFEEYQDKLAVSSTLYVGNLSIYTSEEMIFELFSKCGQIKLIKMGINKKEGTPIGFCFVEFFSHDDAQCAVEYLSKTKLDGRIIRVDWDIGFEEGRQFGRGKGGIQKRDMFRKDDDPDRPKPIQQSYSQPYKKHKYDNNRNY